MEVQTRTMTLRGSGSTHEFDVPGFDACSEVLEQQLSLLIATATCSTASKAASCSRWGSSPINHAGFLKAVLTW